MAQKLVRIALCLLFSSILPSCTPTPSHPSQASLFLYRYNSPAFIELSADFKPGKEIPFSIPPGCSLFDVQPAPAGSFLLVELGCPNGQTVLFLDTGSGSLTQPVTDSDSHFLAWANDGKSAYLKADSFGEANVLRAYTGGKQNILDIDRWTYDLATQSDSDDFVFTFSRGLGTGSEMTLAQGSLHDFQQLYVDRFHYLSFARYSADGSRIAFLKIPDSQTPFTVGELWVMDADGSNARKLADVDAGHGYAASWSPDGKWIAFVKRENVQDESADRSSDSLISNIYLVDVQGGELRQVTHLTSGRAETPHWSPDGNTLAFNTVLNGRMDVQIADIATGEMRSLITEPACCPAWIGK